MGTRIDDPHGKYVADFSLTDTDKGKVDLNPKQIVFRNA